MEIFEYAFMRRAFIVGILLAAVIPCIGLVIVCKRLSMIGDALSHTSLAGVPVKTVNFLFTVLIAVTVSVAARTVGALIVSSMMVVPVACAMQFGTSYRQTLTFAVAFNILFMITGLFAAYYLGLKPGGTIVLVGVIFLILVFAGKRIPRRK